MTMKMLKTLVNLLAIGVFLYAGSQLFLIFYDYYENRQNMNNVQEIYRADEHEPNTQTTGLRAQFEPLKELNEDIIGWITVDDTAIDYPILQTRDNDYYLTRNYLREETRAGSIFMDYRNNISDEEDLNTVIYGHRMKDGTMFAGLKKYLDSSFFNKHPVIYYDTLYQGYDLEVFSVYQTKTDFYYIDTDFSSDKEYGDFIHSLKEKSVHETDVQITGNDRIVTLSTCDYSLDRTEGRLVVHAKLVERG